MSRHLSSRLLNVLVVVSTLLASVGITAPPVQASMPEEWPAAPTAWPAVWSDPTEAVSIGSGRQQLQVPLSRGSRNGLFSTQNRSRVPLPVSDQTADSSHSLVGPTADRSPASFWNLGTDASWALSTERLAQTSHETGETISSTNAWAWDHLVPFYPALDSVSSRVVEDVASPVHVVATPAVSRPSLHTVFLPIVLRDNRGPRYVVISPEGGALISPDGSRTIAFASDGLPESLTVAFVKGDVDRRDLPINLHPFGTPFTIQAYWVSDEAAVVALDREARPIRKPGVAKPQPPQYRYRATVSVQLSTDDLRVVNDEWLTIARLDLPAGKWTLLPTQLDRQTGVATALTERLGTFALVQNMPNTPALDEYDVIVDDLDSGFVRYEEDKPPDPPLYPGSFWWEGSCGGPGCYEGHSFRTYNCSTDYPGTPYCPWDLGVWTPSLSQPGYYLVSVFIPGTHATTEEARYEVHHNGTVSVVTVDQNSSSGQFVPFGAFEFRADGSEEFLYLDDDVIEEGVKETHVGYDAAFFTFAGEAPPSPEEIARLFALGVRRWQEHTGDPVSSSTGNQLQQIEVVRLPGRDGFEAALALTYNGLSEDEGHFGTGWSSLLDVRLKQYYGGSVMVWLPDGQAQYWESDGVGYVGWDGVQGELERIDGGYKLTMPDQTAYIFQEVGWEGRLVRVEDRHGNGANLLYGGDGKVTALTDDAGRSLFFSYGGDHISQVEDPLGRTWGFGYTDSYLTKFSNANGGAFQYTYSGEGYLETLTDPEGITYLQNVYDEDGRVVEQIDASGSHSYFEYDTDAQETTFTDNLGNRTIYRYDDLYRLVEEEDALGQVTAYEYDDDYNLIARVDRMGRRWEYTYDDRGNMLTESGPLGWYYKYTYNETNDLTSATDALGRTTTYVWEGGNLVRIERPDGTAFTYTYDSHGQMLSATDPNGHTTTFTYDAYGNLVEVRTPLGCVTRYEYDIVGRMTAMTDGNGHTMHVEYDGNDNVTRITDPRGNHTEFEYDGNDCLVRMVDRRGGVWTYTYDENLKLIAETDPEGHTTTHTYDAMYNRTSTTDPRGNTTYFRYDALYRLIEVEDALGNVTRYEYDPNDNLVRIVDALGQETELAYDELNRLVRVIDALGGVTAYEYDVVSHLVRLVNPRGAETHYEYDAVDQLTRVVDALGGVTEYDYDAAGNLIAVTDANGHTTHFRYDADDRLIEREDPEGHVTTYEYDCVGNLIRLVDGRGNSTTFEYDENDNLIRVIDALGGETACTYDEEDDRTSVTDPNGNTTHLVYNLDGLLVRLIEAGGQVTRFEYDEAHNLTRLVNAKGNATIFEYDALNRLISETDPLGHTTAYEYDPLGRLVGMTDANGVVTRYEYDPLDQLTAVVQNYRPGEPADHETNVRTEYTYDPVGNLLTIIDANGNVTTFQYDLLDRLIREVNPLGHTWRYEYDPVGNLTRRIDANGAVTDYTYDADDLLVRIRYPDGDRVTFAYDEVHNQVTMMDSLGTTSNTYDALNRRTSSTNHLGQSVSYAYDPAGNRIGVTYPDGRTVRTEYDANNRVSRVFDPDGNVFSAAYDLTHNIVSILYPNLTRALMTYDAADRLLSVVNEQLDGDVISSFAYTLDPVGNRVHTDEYYRWRQPREMSHDYVYDPLYRLVRSEDSEGRLTEYAYDAVGNRMQMTSNYDPLRTPTDVDPYTVDYAYNGANQLLTTDHSVFGVTKYGYDANGNRVRREGPDVWTGNAKDVLRTDYAYDDENRLVEVRNFRGLGNGRWRERDVSDMTYDGYGRLFERGHDVNAPVEGDLVTSLRVSDGWAGRKSVQYVYDGLDPIVECVDPSSQYVNYYRGLGRILEMHEYKSQESPPGTAYYFHHDGLGSVSALTKHQGQSAHTYRYWDYGMVLDKNGRAADASNFTDPHNHYTYTGQEWDERTWLYHFYAREYDPLVGVWLQQDPYRSELWDLSGIHRYQYVTSNPINHIDLLGWATITVDCSNGPVSVWVVTEELELKQLTCGAKEQIDGLCQNPVGEPQFQDADGGVVRKFSNLADIVVRRSNTGDLEWEYEPTFEVVGQVCGQAPLSSVAEGCSYATLKVGAPVVDYLGSALGPAKRFVEHRDLERLLQEYKYDSTAGWKDRVWLEKHPEWPIPSIWFYVSPTPPPMPPPTMSFQIIAGRVSHMPYVSGPEARKQGRIWTPEPR